MEKRLIKKYIFLIIILFVIIIFNPTDSQANTVKNIQKSIELNEDGSASITEIWDVKADSKTELYVPWSNLGDSKFENLVVSDDRGVTYQTVSSWNTKGTLEDKKEKCGINTTTSGIEVCWGISKYGNRKYTLNYRITNYVKECSDNQYVYWQVFPKDFGLEVQSIIVNIKCSQKLNDENAKIWAFGYPNGNIKFTPEGNIVMDSNGKLPSSNYMKLLIKFEEKYFKTASKNSMKFQEIYDKAIVGTEVEKQKKIDMLIKVFTILAAILGIIIIIKMVKTIIKTIKKIKRKITATKFEYETVYEGGKNLPSLNNINYFRDISELDISIEEAYYILIEYNVLEDKDKSNIMGAILLKWIKMGYITIKNAKSGVFNFLKKEYSIDITQLVRMNLDDITERDLRKILQLAAGKDYLLEPREFKEYCKLNSKKVKKFFEDVEKMGERKVKVKNEIRSERINKKKMVRDVLTTCTIYTIALREKAIKLLGLKKYLLDYSKISAREAVEVELWDQYLVYAQLLGIADVVEKQFKEIYPNYQTIINMDNAPNNSESLISSITDSYADESWLLAKKYYERELARERNSYSSSYSSSSSSSISRDYGRGGSSYSGGGTGASGSSSGGGDR